MDTELLTDIKSYRDTKSISYDLVDFTKTAFLNYEGILYRGDSIYKDFLVLGGLIIFHNCISSWSSDYNKAKAFANTNCVPDWYYNEREWCMDYEYPFKGKDQLDLVPVIFVLESRNNLNGFEMAKYINIAEDTEYVKGDEKEFVLGNVQFIITNISKTDDCLINIVKLALREEMI
jgi:hypothetical protein